MSIDTNSLYTAVIGIVSTRIGDRLSKVGTKPAIVRAKGGGVMNKYPYATVDIINISDANSYTTNKYLNEAGQWVYETYKDVVFSISVRANNQESYELCNDVHKAFTFRSALDYLEETAGATVRRTEDIIPIPDYLSERVQEFNTFNVTLTVIDIDVDETSSYISGSEIDGTLKDPSGSEENVNITTP